MATLRSALNQLLAVIDGTANANMSDVIGNKNDTVAGNSIMALIKFAANETILVNNRLHNTNKVYPTLADGIVVMTDIDPWVLGNPVEIVPANAINQNFDIHFIEVEGASATDVYELVLYSGAPGSLVEIGRIRTSKQTANTGATSVPFPCEIQPANTRISARIAAKIGASHTLTISLAYNIST